MRKSPLYTAFWAAILVAGLIGLPRFLGILSDFGRIKNDFEGYKLLVTSIVFALHLPIALALLWALVFPPRREGFSKLGAALALMGGVGVATGFVVWRHSSNATQNIQLQFTDLSGKPVSNVEVTLKWEIKGFVPSTSYLKTDTFVSTNGMVAVDKTIRQSLAVVARKPGLANLRVWIPPIGAPYPKGPLQKVDISWALDRERSDKSTIASSSRNWRLASGPLAIPMVAGSSPVISPLPSYSAEDWRQVTDQ